jgi:hypothetical protein
MIIRRSRRARSSGSRAEFPSRCSSGRLLAGVERARIYRNRPGRRVELHERRLDRGTLLVTGIAARPGRKHLRRLVPGDFEEAPAGRKAFCVADMKFGISPLLGLALAPPIDRTLVAPRRPSLTKIVPCGQLPVALKTRHDTGSTKTLSNVSCPAIGLSPSFMFRPEDRNIQLRQSAGTLRSPGRRGVGRPSISLSSASRRRRVSPGRGRDAP